MWLVKTQQARGHVYAERRSSRRDAHRRVLPFSGNTVPRARARWSWFGRGLTGVWCCPQLVVDEMDIDDFPLHDGELWSEDGPFGLWYDSVMTDVAGRPILHNSPVVLEAWTAVPGVLRP